MGLTTFLRKQDKLGMKPVLANGLVKYGNDTVEPWFVETGCHCISKLGLASNKFPANNNKINTYSRSNVSVTVFIISHREVVRVGDEYERRLR